MLCFARTNVAAQVALLHPTLWTIVQEIAGGLWLEHTAQEHVVVTDLFRTHEQTVAFYARAGLPVPDDDGHASIKVNGDPLSGCRAADLGVRMQRPGMRWDEWPLLPTDLVRALVRAVNERWRYQANDAQQVAQFNTAGEPHVHVGVRPGNETVRRASA